MSDTKKENPRKAAYKDGLVHIKFPYDYDMKETVKSFKASRFEKERKVWTVDITSPDLKNVRDFLINNGFEIFPVLQKAFDYYISNNDQNIDLPEKVDLEVPSLKGTLREFQKVGIDYMVRNRRVIVGDDMGVGKTIEAIGATEYLDSYKALVIVRDIVKKKWKREYEKWTDRRVEIVEHGDTRDLIVAKYKENDVIIMNYLTMVNHYNTIVGFFKDINTFIVDESQYIKNYKAKRTEAAQNIAQLLNPPYRFELTGTVVSNRPKELISQLNVLDKLDHFGGFWNFATRYCDAKKTRYGTDLSGAINLDDLHRELKKICYIRREKEEVIDELPDKQIVDLDVSITNAKEYRDAETNLLDYLYKNLSFTDDEVIKHHQLSSMDWVGSTESEKNEYRDQYLEYRLMKAERGGVLVELNKLRYIAMKGKIKAVKEWIDNFFDENPDGKLVVAGIHNEFINQLHEYYLQKYRALKITGNERKDRDDIITMFQNQPDKQLIFINQLAAGVGVDLDAASNILFMEEGWTPADMEQVEDRLHRMTQKNPVTAYYMQAEGTIDDYIHSINQKKREITNQINKGEVSKEEVSKTSTQVEVVKQLNSSKK